LLELNYIKVKKVDGLSYSNIKVIDYSGLKLKKRFIFENDSLDSIEILKKAEKPQINDIYIGKIVNFVKEIDAYFVDFDKYTGLLKSKTKYKMGQVIPVIVEKEERDKKGYRLNEKIYIKGINVIYFPDDTKCRFSKKISDEKTKILKDLLEEKEGFLFRTSCEELDIEGIREEMKILKDVYLEILRSNELKGKSKLMYRTPDEYEDFIVKPDLGEIIECEELLDNHLQNQIILSNQTRINIEKTSLGVIIDFDSYKYKGNKRNDYLKINKEMMEEALREIKIRNLNGIILIDVISMNNKNEIKEFMNFLYNEIMKYKNMRVHSLTRLGIVEITRRIEKTDIMNFNKTEILFDKIYLRIKYFKECTEFNKMVVYLNSRYFEFKLYEKELQNEFDFPIEYVYNFDVENYSIKLK